MPETNDSAQQTDSNAANNSQNDTTTQAGQSRSGQSASGQDAAAGQQQQGQSGAGQGQAAAQSGNGEGPDAKLDLSAFSDEAKKIIESRQYETLGALGDGLVAAEKLVGANKVAAPVAGETVKWWGENKELVGSPAEAKDYKLPDITMPDGVSLDEAAVERWKNFAAENSVPQDVFALFAGAMMQDRIDVIAGRETSVAEAEKKALDGLRGELKGDYDKTVDLSVQAAKHLGVDGEVADILDAKMGSAGAIKFFARLGGMLEEGGVKLGEGIGFTEAQADARREIDAMKGDTDFMKRLKSKAMDGHKQAQIRWQRAHAIAEGEKPEV